ncbi:hypothetical protein SDC9_127174 [bioreactor metagenome]|uniref:Uncharacterized protein n=1 Tax=bioreactor metagenome TaxID=1076179 RepID=A0A645CTD8_9ZZZZ
MFIGQHAIADIDTADIEITINPQGFQKFLYSFIKLKTLNDDFLIEIIQLFIDRNPISPKERDIIIVSEFRIVDNNKINRIRIHFADFIKFTSFIGSNILTERVFNHGN